MKKPDFFILGAPKCGTTSLADWLREHPLIFMSTPKEPHYFNTDSNHHGALNLAHYESFFSSANALHEAVGEASVWYLISEAAVDNILEYQPEARFIVCVRNPVEMAVSLHDQKRFTGDENIEDFLEAWHAQQGRSDGTLPRPPVCADIRHFMYGESCLLGRHLERVYSKTGRDRVLVVFMDDMKSNPGGVYRTTLQFLGVPEDGRDNFEPSNQAKERIIPWLRTFQRRAHLLKQRLGLKRGTGLGRLLNDWNRRQRARGEVPPSTRTLLEDYFRDDIHLLGRLTERDLHHWFRN
jgi:hypothetical protein